MTVVVLNAETLAVSEHTGTLADVFASAGKLYRVEVQRLAMQDATAAPDFVSSFKTGDLDFEPLSRTRVIRAYPRITADDDLTLTLAYVEIGDERTDTYTVAVPEEFSDRPSTVRLGRGPQSSRWALTLSGNAVRWALSGLGILFNPVRN